MRKHYSATFKAQVVQQMLREDKTFAQLASEHEVHVNQLREQQVTDLYAEIGRLTTELSWLKKKLP